MAMCGTDTECVYLQDLQDQFAKIAYNYCSAGLPIQILLVDREGKGSYGGGLGPDSRQNRKLLPGYIEPHLG